MPETELTKTLLDNTRLCGDELQVVDRNDNAVATQKLSSDQQLALKAVQDNGSEQRLYAIAELRMTTSLGLIEAKQLIDWAVRRLNQP
jgi:ribosomal protein L7/L12